MYAHLIKGFTLVALLFTIYLSNTNKAEAWTPCMPICDFLCTAPAALSMSLSSLASHLDLSKELLANINAINNLSTSLVERNASISAKETVNMTTKITALDGFSFKTTTTLARNAMESAISMDNHIQQLENLSNNVKEDMKSMQSINMLAKGQSDSYLTALAASSTIQKNVEIMDDLRIASDEVQFQNNRYDSHDEQREVVGLLSDISQEIPNPFVTDDVDMKFYMDYQKQLISLYNHEIGPPRTIEEATERIKKRLIIDALNLYIFENASFEGNGLIEDLTMSTLATVARAKADAYKKLMFEKDAIASIDTQTISTLMLTKIIVTSQKNLLLNEILKVKKQKNLLLALDSI